MLTYDPAVPVRRTWSQALAYLLWLISTLLTVVSISALRQGLLRLLIGLSRESGGLHGTGPINHWTVEAVDQFGILIFGALGLVFVIICERIYTDGAEKGKLAKRFGFVTGVQILLLALSAIQAA